MPSSVVPVPQEGFSDDRGVVRIDRVVDEEREGVAGQVQRVTGPVGHAADTEERYAVRIGDLLRCRGFLVDCINGGRLASQCNPRTENTKFGALAAETIRDRSPLRRKAWAVLYLLAAAVAGALPGIWAFFSQQVAVVFTFPNNTTDAVVHLVTAALMIGVALVQIRRDCGLRNSLADLTAR